MKIPFRQWHLMPVLLIAAALLPTSCGAGKSATTAVSAKEQTELTKAEIDTLQHEAARLAMEQGEFVFMVTRVFFMGKNIPATPRSSYLEVIDNKLFFQVGLPDKEAKRAASKIGKTTFSDESGKFKMSIATSSIKSPFFDVFLTLYPGSNKASGELGSWMGIEGIILPHRLAQISRSAPSSSTETFDAW